jgi:serine/threonine protein kinase
MRKLQGLLKLFLAREIGLEELQRRFALLLQEDANLAAPAAAWLDAGEQDGRLSSTVCMSLKNVIVSSLAATSHGPDPRDSGVFGPEEIQETASQPIFIDDFAEKPQKPQKTQKIQKTQLGNDDRTMIGTEVIAQQQDHSRTRVADRIKAKVDTVLSIGSVIGERYELLSQLGEGGMGTVFKARDRLREAAQDRKPFIALKVLSETFREHKDAMIALQREARRAQSLAHPNVITVHEFFQDGPHFYMTMELLDGHPLDHLVRTDFFGGVSMDVAWPIIECVGKALQYGHEQGIVHSDIKPGNIFVCDNSVVKVLDFGISRPIPLSDVPETEQTVFDARKRLGTLTPSYASLEMWYGDDPHPKDDIYSLACVTYLLLGGKHPFTGSSAKKAFEDKRVPERISSITFRQWSAISGGLRLRRRNRIGSVTEFLNALSPENTGRQRRRVVALLALLLIAAGIGIGLNDYRMKLEDRVLEDQNGQSTPVESKEVTQSAQEELEALVRLARLDLASIDENASAMMLDNVLSKGHNSVLQSVKSALAINPGYEEALAVRKDVLKLFSEKAREYYEREDYESAMLMAVNAQNISNKRAIRNLIDDICDSAPAVCEP